MPGAKRAQITTEYVSQYRREQKTHNFARLGDCAVGDRNLCAHQVIMSDRQSGACQQHIGLTGAGKPPGAPQADVTIPLRATDQDGPVRLRCCLTCQEQPLTRGIGRKQSCRPLKLACLQPRACCGPQARRAAMAARGLAAVG